MRIEYEMDSSEKVFANHNLMLSCIPECALNDRAYENYMHEMLSQDNREKLSAKLQAALMQLTDIQRTALILNACYKMSHKEIAVRMNCGRRNVTNHINAAKRKMKKLLAK